MREDKLDKQKDYEQAVNTAMLAFFENLIDELVKKKEAFQKDLLNVSSNTLSTNGNNEDLIKQIEEDDDIITIDDEINETPKNLSFVEGVVDELKNENLKLVKRMEVFQQEILDFFKDSKAFSENQEKLPRKMGDMSNEDISIVDLDNSSVGSSLENPEDLDNSSVESFSENPEELDNASVESSLKNQEKSPRTIESKLNEIRENLVLDNASVGLSLENQEELVSIIKSKSNKIPEIVDLDNTSVVSPLENPEELVSKISEIVDLDDTPAVSSLGSQEELDSKIESSPNKKPVNEDFDDTNKKLKKGNLVFSKLKKFATSPKRDKKESVRRPRSEERKKKTKKTKKFKNGYQLLS